KRRSSGTHACAPPRYDRLGEEVGAALETKGGRGLRPCPRRIAPTDSVFVLPVVDVLDPGDQADAAPRDLARAGVVAAVVRIARPVSEQRQAVRAGPERVRDSRSRRPCDPP